MQHVWRETVTPEGHPVTYRVTICPTRHAATYDSRFADENHVPHKLLSGHFLRHGLDCDDRS